MTCHCGELHTLQTWSEPLTPLSRMERAHARRCRRRYHGDRPLDRPPCPERSHPMADRIAVLLALALTLSAGPAGYARAPRDASGTMNLDLRSRDPATGEPRIDRVAIDP